MREDLLEHTDGLRIATTRSDTICAYSGDTIPSGTDALLIRAYNYNTSKNELTNKSYAVWVKLKHQDDLREDLDSFNFRSSTPREDISPTGFIGYSTSKGHTHSCPICKERVPKGEDAVVFRNRSSPDREQTVWCHTKCVPMMCGGLGNIEDYTTKIVSANI